MAGRHPGKSYELNIDAGILRSRRRDRDTDVIIFRIPPENTLKTLYNSTSIRHRRLRKPAVDACSEPTLHLWLEPDGRAARFGARDAFIRGGEHGDWGCGLPEY